jgi:hypothetical protein
MASNFQDAGDFFASDLVKATINKITWFYPINSNIKGEELILSLLYLERYC